MALPSGYTQLSCIQSSGTQYIDTGFKPNNNTRVVMRAAFTDTSNSGVLYLFGASNDDGTTFGLCYGVTSGAFYADYGLAGLETLAMDNALQDVEIDANKNVFTLNGKSASYTSEEFTISYSLFLFCKDTYGLKTGHSIAKLYSSQIYDNGTLVRDFVPCKNGSGEVGLYDQVGGKFYANAGTGTFVAGEGSGSGSGGGSDTTSGSAGATLVAGTAYDTTGGRTLVNGTGYSILKGRTLVDGTGYDVSFQSGGSGDAEFVTVSINHRGIGTPDSSGDICCAVVDGTVYNNASLSLYDDGPVLSVPHGTEITCYVRGAYVYYHIKKDGVYVTTLGDSTKKVLSYSFYVTADTEIVFTYSTASLGDSAEYCWIEITTS